MIPPVQAPSVLLETAPRRQLTAELAGIQEQLKKFSTQDELSQEIEEWSSHLSAALKTNGDEKIILETYIELLQELLIDSYTQTPLDDQAFLGSDGRAYSYKVLALHYNSVPEEKRALSPLGDANFTAQPHETARYMVEWLKKHGSFKESDEIHQCFLKLTPEQLQYIIPTPSNNRIRRIIRLQKEREAPLAPVQEMQQRVEEMFQRLQGRVEVFSKQANEKLDAIELRDQEQLAELKQRATKLEEEIKVHDAGIEKIIKKLAEVDSKITAAEKQDLEIQLGIEKVKQTIRKKKQRMMTICIVAASVAGCALGTWALSAALAKTSCSAAILPKIGGALLKFSVVL